MKILYKDKEVEAFSLVLQKKYAKEIVDGKKTIEIRAATDKYFDMFSDKEMQKANDLARKEKRFDDIVPPFRRDVEGLHFYNYSGTMELDVLIDDWGFALMTKEDIEFLNEEFDFHDYDNEWQKFAELADEDKPAFFWFHISEILSYRGIE